MAAQQREADRRAARLGINTARLRFGDKSSSDRDGVNILLRHRVLRQLRDPGRLAVPGEVPGVPQQVPRVPAVLPRHAPAHAAVPALHTLASSRQLRAGSRDSGGRGLAQLRLQPGQLPQHQPRPAQDLLLRLEAAQDPTSGGAAAAEAGR